MVYDSHSEKTAFGALLSHPPRQAPKPLSSCRGTFANSKVQRRMDQEYTPPKPLRVTRHIQFDKGNHAEFASRFAETIGISMAVRILIDDYLKEPDKFSLRTYEAQ